MIRLSLALAAALLAGPLAAQETGTPPDPTNPAEPRNFQLELNHAATLEGDICQLIYVATNDSAEDLQQASYLVGFFDAEGIVRQILLLEFGALPPGKTKIVPFNLPDRPCEDLSRIVVNDVAQCALADGTDSDLCSAALSTSSRSAIQFGL